MRLISLNVALFEPNNHLLSTFLSKQNVDMLSIQEISEKIDVSVNPDYVSKQTIDKATKDLHYSFFAPTWMIKDFHKKNFHKKESFDFTFGKKSYISNNYYRRL